MSRTAGEPLGRSCRQDRTPRAGVPVGGLVAARGGRAIGADGLGAGHGGPGTS
ncbi:MAG: hypothetical protein QOF77_2160 [Solirubrobacteraceae bacterium]|nr:hypothetical protein [Solirubrobacteraceae bacterium]